MKKMLVGVLFLIAGVSEAGSTVQLSQRQVELDVDISTAKVKLSDIGYSLPLVKVLVPGLADVTLLNHRNEGEAAPCLATYQAESPEDVIQNNPAVEKAVFTITLNKYTYPDEKLGKCRVSVQENIVGKVRGFTFVHDRVKEVDLRHLDDCR